MQHELHARLAPQWPATGRHILASYDATTVVVYQAYRPSIGRFAAEHGTFVGSPFALSRMSWVKPNFLWMMYRSGWGTKPDQEITLAIRLARTGFDTLLAAAVSSSFDARGYPTREAWQDAVAASDVRVQWDPDHDPSGRPLERRALQLGLRGAALARYVHEWIVAIEDVSSFVAEERAKLEAGRSAELRVPTERIYPVADAVTAQRLGITRDT